MHRTYSTLAICLLLVLPGLAACGGGGANDDALAGLETEWAALQKTDEELDAKRTELADLRAELAARAEEEGEDAGTGGDEAAEGEVPAEGEDLAARVEALGREIAAMADSFTQEVVAFTNKTIDLAAETEEEPETHARVMELQAASIRMKSDEDILIAQEYIDKGGDYRRAIEIYQAALRFDPDYASLQEALAAAEANRFMTEERFAQVKKGMTQDEVRETLGPVNRNLIQDYPDRKVTAWFYPKGERTGAAGVYFEEKKGVYRVYRFDFNAASAPGEDEGEGAATP